MKKLRTGASAAGLLLCAAPSLAAAAGNSAQAEERSVTIPAQLSESQREA